MENTIRQISQQLENKNSLKFQAKQRNFDNLDPTHFVQEYIIWWEELDQMVFGDLKANASKINLLPIVLGSWMSHVEQFLAWVGGFKPSIIVTLIINHVLLSEQEAEKMEALKLAAMKEETNITNNITNLRDTLINSFSGKSFVDKGDFSAMNGFSNQMSENLGRLSVLKNYYDQADELRIHILQKMVDLIKIRQRSMIEKTEAEATYYDLGFL
ncbi:transcription factor TGA2.1-like [Rutidosis leptorrhynchoides]|uniref:transcription factor TGA2.1-like n=1 Tax=Rutidosis leptorrhynchoides TaxID=125765 RepID=UPI003A993909